MEAALVELRSTLLDRNENYKIDGEFSNFEFAATIAGIDPLDVMMSQTAIKLGRIKGLWSKERVDNDALLDSYKDLAGYSVIMFAYALQHLYDQAPENVSEDEEW